MFCLKQLRKISIASGVLSFALLSSQTAMALTMDTNGGPLPSSGTDYGGFFGGLFDPTTFLADFESSSSNMDVSFTSGGTSAADEIKITGNLNLHRFRNQVFFSSRKLNVSDSFY